MFDQFQYFSSFLVFPVLDKKEPPYTDQISLQSISFLLFNNIIIIIIIIIVCVGEYFERFSKIISHHTRLDYSQAKIAVDSDTTN